MQRTNREPCGARAPQSAVRNPQSKGFTLVELLVVITIIGVLSALLLVAARGAIAAGKRAEIRAEITQIATAIEDYKNGVDSYPPNAQTDLPNESDPNGHLNDTVVQANFKRHFSKAFPSHRERPELIDALVGQHDGSDDVTNLPGGMNAAEALVFWLGGFSDDPKYPISGPGGPAYSIETPAGAAIGNPNHADPIDNRSWRLGIDVTRLAPRAVETNIALGAEGSYFPATSTRFITYQNRLTGRLSRINFWYLLAPDSEAPYVYFDASRGSGATSANDTPAATLADGVISTADPAIEPLFNVHAVKAPQPSSTATNPFVYANDGKFQLLHAGLDSEWGSFPMANPGYTPGGSAPALIDAQTYHETGVAEAISPPTFPEGPWALELADTLSNLSDGTLEDSQP